MLSSKDLIGIFYDSRLDTLFFPFVTMEHMPVRCNGRAISLREAMGEIIDLSTKNDLHSSAI